MSFKTIKEVVCEYSQPIRISAVRFVADDGNESSLYVNIRFFKVENNTERPTKNGICFTMSEFNDYMTRIVIILSSLQGDDTYTSFEEEMNGRKFSFEMGRMNFSMQIVKPEGRAQRIFGPNAALKAIVDKRRDVFVRDEPEEREKAEVIEIITYL